MTKSKQSIKNSVVRGRARQQSNAVDAEQTVDTLHAGELEQLVSTPAFDLAKLAPELAKLRAAMRGKASTADEDLAVARVAAAEKAVGSGKMADLLNELKAAGAWALDVAKAIGVPVATAALKHALGL